MAILFLAGAILVATIGIILLILANREPPRSSLSSIDDFARQTEALAPKRESGAEPMGEPGPPGGSGRSERGA